MNDFLIALIIVILTGPVAGCITWINCLFMAMISEYMKLDKPTNMYYLYVQGREENPARDKAYFPFTMFPLLGGLIAAFTEFALLICVVFLIYCKLDSKHKFSNWVRKVWNKITYPFAVVWKKLKLSIYNKLCHIEINGIDNN